MTWDRKERRQRTRNYRVMFRLALAFLAMGVVVTLVGGIRAIVDADTRVLVYGMLMLVGGVGSAYLTVDSTVRIIEQDADEFRKVR